MVLRLYGADKVMTGTVTIGARRDGARAGHSGVAATRSSREDMPRVPSG